MTATSTYPGSNASQLYTRSVCFFFQAEDGIRDLTVTGVQTCALPICRVFLPGTSAEILDQEIRDTISRGRITVDQWVEVITTAHALGIRTTSTIMYGHVETPAHWIRHMALLRSIQKDTGGFTEFVPLSLIHSEAPMYAKRLVDGVRPGATGIEVVKLHALARLMLGAALRNIQSSWVKEGPKLAQLLLDAGANDLGGTLINESI